jgi:hypothetical protein
VAVTPAGNESATNAIAPKAELMRATYTVVETAGPPLIAVTELAPVASTMDGGITVIPTVALLAGLRR